MARSHRHIRLLFIAPAVPYVTVGAGLWLLRSGWAALAGYHLGIIAVLALARAWRDLKPRLLTGWHPLWFALAVVPAALSGLVVIWLWPWAGGQHTLDARLAAWHLPARGWLPFVLYWSLVNPWLEESLWRGYLEDAGPRSRHKCLSWSDLWFAGYHLIVLWPIVNWPWLLFSFAILVAAAWLWRQAARSTGGLLVPVLAHIAADASILLAVGILRTRI